MAVILLCMITMAGCAFFQGLTGQLDQEKMAPHDRLAESLAVLDAERIAMKRKFEEEIAPLRERLDAEVAQLKVELERLAEERNFEAATAVGYTIIEKSDEIKAIITDAHEIFEDDIDRISREISDTSFHLGQVKEDIEEQEGSTLHKAGAWTAAIGIPILLAFLGKKSKEVGQHRSKWQIAERAFRGTMRYLDTTDMNKDQIKDLKFYQAEEHAADYARAKLIELRALEGAPVRNTDPTTSEPMPDAA